MTQSSNVQDMFENTSPAPSPVMNARPASGGIPPVEHHEAVQTEVKKRHWQRWVFYGLTIIIVAGAVALMVRIYNDNSELLLAVSQTQDELRQKSEALSQKEQEFTQVSQSLQQAQAELDAKADQYRQEIEGQAGSVTDLEQCRLELSSADANIYNLILEIGTGISNEDIARIPLADSNLTTGVDTDADTLSDEVEAALGTDPAKADTDGDGFTDKEEILGGFDPLQANARLNVDTGYANQQKGKILLQVDGNNEAWYIGPEDGKRYFLGRPGDAYKAMRSIEFWTKEFSRATPPVTSPVTPPATEPVTSTTPPATEPTN